VVDFLPAREADSPQVQVVDIPPAREVDSPPARVVGFQPAPEADSPPAPEVDSPPAQVVDSLRVLAILGDACLQNRERALMARKERLPVWTVLFMDLRCLVLLGRIVQPKAFINGPLPFLSCAAR